MYKLENVSPKAIRQFMTENNLVVGKERGRYVAFHESAFITVLDFSYPFLRNPEECKTLIEHLKNTPKHVKQDMYRLIYREQKPEPVRPTQEEILGSIPEFIASQE